MDVDRINFQGNKRRWKKKKTWKPRNKGSNKGFKKGTRSKATDKCFNCGKQGHWTRNCPNKSNAMEVDVTRRRTHRKKNWKPKGQFKQRQKSKRGFKRRRPFGRKGAYIEGSTEDEGYNSDSEQDFQ